MTSEEERLYNKKKNICKDNEPQKCWQKKKFSEMKAKKFSLLFIYVIWVVPNMF